jgi:hypothetical protein
MSKPRYELYVGGVQIAKYKTQGQALLGAVWRSRKYYSPVYVWDRMRCIAKVYAVPEAG